MGHSCLTIAPLSELLPANTQEATPDSLLFFSCSSHPPPLPPVAFHSPASQPNLLPDASTDIPTNSSSLMPPSRANWNKRTQDVASPSLPNLATSAALSNTPIQPSNSFSNLDTLLREASFLNSPGAPSRPSLSPSKPLVSPSSAPLSQLPPMLRTQRARTLKGAPTPPLPPMIRVSKQTAVLPHLPQPSALHLHTTATGPVAEGVHGSHDEAGIMFSPAHGGPLSEGASSSGLFPWSPTWQGTTCSPMSEGYSPFRHSVSGLSTSERPPSGPHTRYRRSASGTIFTLHGIADGNPVLQVSQSQQLGPPDVVWRPLEIQVHTNTG